MSNWMETRTALLAVLNALAKEYPPLSTEREADRDLMNWYIRRQDYHSARMCAVWSGIPEERINAIAALLD